MTRVSIQVRFSGFLAQSEVGTLLAVLRGVPRQHLLPSDLNSFQEILKQNSSYELSTDFYGSVRKESNKSEPEIISDIVENVRGLGLIAICDYTLHGARSQIMRCVHAPKMKKSLLFMRDVYGEYFLSLNNTERSFSRDLSIARACLSQAEHLKLRVLDNAKMSAHAVLAERHKGPYWEQEVFKVAL